MSKSKKGTCRRVFTLPTLGLALKVPLISTGKFWESVRSARKPRERFYHDLFLTSYQTTRDCVKKRLLRGLMENLHEALFSLIVGKSKPIAKTYFSLFGVLNITRYEEPLCLSKEELSRLKKRLRERIGENELRDSHLVDTSTNFARRGNDLIVLDYGSAKTRTILLMHGEKFFNFFEEHTST